MRQMWTYKARSLSGEAVTGEIEGETREQVVEVISDQGLIPTAVKPRPERISFAAVVGSFGSANRERLIIFTRELKTLYRAGIPLLRALAIIERSGKELGLTNELAGIKSDLQAGLTLSKALARYPKTFPPIYVSSIAAGEASGTMDEVLDQLAFLIEKELALSRQIKSAIRYPAMVIGVIGCALVVLMTFVIPRFADIYGRYGAALPLPTQIVVGTSRFFAAYWYLFAAILVVLAVALKKHLATEKGRLFWDEWLMKIPLVGDLIIKANAARFAIMLKILFRSGVPMVACLQILRETIANKVIAREIGLMADSFERGREIGHNRDDYRFFPAMALEMFTVGLESGSVETMMEELAGHYELELEYKSRHLTEMLEPILTLVIGCLVLVLALAIFLPMWNLIQIFR
jgi:MSHA biogenesis protein MshG